MKFDLTRYQTIGVHPLNGIIGAEISGVDASRSLSAAVTDELREALSQFHVLFFRDQRLDVARFARFAEVFGEIGTSPLSPPASDKQGMISHMAREADVPADTRNNGDRWHTDRAHDACPPKGFLLYCEEAPDYGGDTLFASLCGAFDALPQDLQERCAQLTGVHCMSGVLDVDGKSGIDRQSIDGAKRRAEWADPAALDYIRKECEHPLVCRHPESDRPMLFVSGAYLIRIKELGLEEGLELIDRLNRHAVRPEFTCRFRWRKGSIAVLDNRCTQHYAVNDYAGFARRMLRAELCGDWRPERVDLASIRQTAACAA
jgi:taurine dioxygenase